MVNSSYLNHDLLVEIARRIPKVEDFVAFGSVCQSWRLATTKQNFSNLVQIPSLMLANDDKTSVSREFYSLYDHPIHEFTLPEANGKRCFFSQGWIITIGIFDLEVNLLNPITRCQITLPNLVSLLHLGEQHEQPLDLLNSIYIDKVVLSSGPCSTSDYAVMVVFGDYSECPRLGFCKARDSAWTVVETRFAVYHDIIYYKGKFYAMEGRGRVLVCDVNDPNLTIAEVLSVLPEYYISIKEKLYLVEVSGKLFVVLREGFQTLLPDYRNTKFHVLELDGGDGRNWEEVKIIGNMALFLGDNSSFSLNVHFTPCKANCIYFTDDLHECYHDNEALPHGGGRDMGVYNLLDGSLE